jgi:hypothetical protein
MVSFWQLALPELAVPVKAYATTISRFEASMARLETWTGLRSLAADWVDAYRSNKMELVTLVDKLRAEQQDQEKLVATAAARLDSEKNHWFPGERSAWCLCGYTVSHDLTSALQRNPLSERNVTWPDFYMPLVSIREPSTARPMPCLSLVSVDTFMMQELQIFRFSCSMRR